MLTVRTSENTVITSFRLISERQDFSSVRTGENTVRARARIHIVSLNVFLLWVSVTVGVELSRSREASVWGTCFEGLWRTIKNPVIIGILLGLLSSWADIGLPEPFEKSLTLLSASATPVALFSVGTGLSRYKLSSHVRLTGASIFLKLFIQPATVFILCFLFEITGIERQAACLLASLPVGVNVYIMAQEFASD
ncbi:MAG: AEC family transporter [Parasutterella sp.]